MPSTQPIDAGSHSGTFEEKAAFYSREYNARAAIPEHSRIFTRWQKESAHARRMQAGLLDIAYGEAPGERLDFFPTPKSGAPLLVFIHGGWWRSLDKSDFTFVVAPFTRAGYNVALTNYTLAPQASIEEIVRQQLRALARLYRNAEAYDFDAGRIAVAGHSAGAHLAAMLMAAQWPRLGDDLPADLVKGGILLSGLYDLAPVPYAEFVNVDLRLTAESAAALSPARMPPSHPAPFITAVGGLESSEFRRQTALIGNAWHAGFRGDVPLPDANHLTICDAFAAPDSALQQASLALLEEAFDAR
ncbi:MAG: alpha/beta hydrolase [Burkholderiaceae bacterium]